MKAMILAAGLGRRLKPLTDSTPKSLVPLAGKPLLFYIIEKLIAAGINQIIINVHHFAETIIKYVEQNKKFGIEIVFSHEETLLDTGGGLKKASWFFDDGQSFILHNVDVLSGIDLSQMMAYHNQKKSLVTLAVRERKTSRYLLFNQENRLVGWQSLETGNTEMVGESGQNPENLSFMGIHVLSPEIFPLLPCENIFSIIKAYLDLAKKGHTIIGYRNDENFWVDLGRKENLQKAEDYILSKT
jgi:NDP-sugar pyrophosphorylase family protein